MSFDELILIVSCGKNHLINSHVKTMRLLQIYFWASCVFCTLYSKVI